MKLSSSKLLRIPGLSGGELYTIKFNSFQPNFPFRYSLKISENKGFFCIEMEHRVKMG